jgi:GNAT superfamily N-acetyltransferase
LPSSARCLYRRNRADDNVRDSVFEVRRDGFEISTDPVRLDIDRIQALIRTSYWAAERSRKNMEASLRNSRCFGLYDASNGRQIGLARVVTDYATFAWICDVIVERGYRRNGLGIWLMETVLADPQLRNVRRWTLATRNAHRLYERFGFVPLAHPDSWMENRSRP